MINNFSNFISIIKAAAKARRKAIKAPYTKLNKKIIDIFYKRGFIASYQLSIDKKFILIFFRYADSIYTPLAYLKIVSAPGLKMYSNYRFLAQKYRYMEAFISTSSEQRIISSRKIINAGKFGIKIGGEILFTI